MIRENITIDEALEVLNRALKADPVAMTALFGHRVGCNKKLGEDPEVQCWDFKKMTHEEYDVGVMGIINGLFGVDKNNIGSICALWNDGCLLAFKRVD